jgi:integrase
VRAYAHDLQKLYQFLAHRGWVVEQFTPARAVQFVEWLRTCSSGRRAQQLDLALTAGGGRLLSAKTCNRVLAAVSSFFEFLITIERYRGADNPLVTIADHAAARVPGRARPPLVTSRPQRPVRRALRVKTVEALPRPMSAETYGALLAVLRTRRDRALLELMWEGGLRPGEVLGMRLEDISYGRRRIVVRHRNDHPVGVRQKSRRDRTVDLLEGRALPAVSDYVMHERPADAPTSYVFLVGGRGKRRHEPLSYDGLCRMFARAARRAGVRDARPQPSRHQRLQGRPGPRHPPRRRGQIPHRCTAGWSGLYHSTTWSPRVMRGCWAPAGWRSFPTWFDTTYFAEGLRRAEQRRTRNALAADRPAQTIGA